MRRLNSFQKAYAVLVRENRKANFRKIAAMTGMSKSSAHRIWHKRNTLRRMSDNIDERNARRKPGPKARLDLRDKRMLLRTFQKMRKNKRHITVMSLVKEAGLDPTRLHRKT